MQPNVSAFLDMLAFSEGTSALGQNGYNVIVGGQLFTSYLDHPRVMIDLPKLKIKSSAAGRYQILARYFDAYRVTLKLKDFSPDSQDKIAIQMIREQQAYADVVAGRIVIAINKCSDIWASLPGNNYGQHQHKVEDLIGAYLSFGGKAC